ncbi:MAG: hypothetical protein QM791_02955 [Ferruginibacter sp.]
MITQQKMSIVAAYESSMGLPEGSLLDVMIFETSGTLDVDIKNHYSGATGLIQFMPATASGLGTSTALLAQMTFEQQMVYVQAYFKPYLSKLRNSKDPFDVYCAVLYPKLIGQPDTTLFAVKDTKIYQQNNPLDENKDGKITKLEIRTKFYRIINKYRRNANIPIRKPDWIVPTLIIAGLLIAGNI